MTLDLSQIVNQEEVKFPFLDKPVKLYKLENGHTVVIAYKQGDLVNVSTWVKTGSINEDDNITGISHFLEHLMFKGTNKYGPGEFDRILEAKGAIVNAATWKDYTFYYVTLPKGENNEQFVQALELHADMMIDPVFPDEEIGKAFDFKNDNVEEKRERYVVIEEIRMRDDQPWTRTYNKLNNLMYNEHPYKLDVIGTGEVIASIARSEIVDYYNKWYTPENFTTIIVGDVDEQETLELIKKNFVFKNTEKNPKPVYTPEPEQTKERYVEKTGKINTGFAIMGFHAPKATSLKESIAIEMVSISLGEGKSCRLYQNLIEKPDLPIFNLIGSTQYNFKDGNTFFIQMNFKPENKDEALNTIKNEINELYDNKITEQEFNKAKKRLKSQFASESETVSEIGEGIGYYMTVCESLSCYVEYLEILNNITINDVYEIAKKYIDLNKASISVLMPE